MGATIDRKEDNFVFIFKIKRKYTYWWILLKKFENDNLIRWDM